MINYLNYLKDINNYNCKYKMPQHNSSSNLGGSGAPTPNYPKNHVKKIKLTLPICKR
eukprot:SAG11_NODE_31209_length_293_cov_7.206186_1_plen_56_part_10